MTYYEKYLKYKTKYLALKKQTGGNINELIKNNIYESGNINMWSVIIIKFNNGNYDVYGKGLNDAQKYTKFFGTFQNLVLKETLKIIVKTRVPLNEKDIIDITTSNAAAANDIKKGVDENYVNNIVNIYKINMNNTIVDLRYKSIYLYVKKKIIDKGKEKETETCAGRLYRQKPEPGKVDREIHISNCNKDE